MKISYSVPIDGTKISLGPFPFQARSITIVNLTGANAFAMEDGGAQYVASSNTSATYGIGNTTRLLCYLSGAQAIGQTVTVIVSDEDAPVSVQQIANLQPTEPTLQIAHNHGLTGTEPELDFIDNGANAFTVADDAGNKRVTVQGARVITGEVTGAGAVQAGSGFTVNRTGVGRYIITFTTPFAAAPSVVATIIAATGTEIITMNQPNPNSVQINVDTPAAATIDASFCFIAFAMS